MKDFEKHQAALQLMNELSKGRKSGEEKGWLTLEAVKRKLGIVNESSDACTDPKNRGG